MPKVSVAACPDGPYNCSMLSLIRPMSARPIAGLEIASSPGGKPLLRDIHHEVLDNGLRVFLIESHEVPVVSHWIWYTVGSRDERSGESGLSHFLEHMMFKGTPDFPKGSIDAATARMGGSNNAMTSQDYTAYYFNLASDRWTEALKIEASRMTGCLLDQVEFESEKKVVIEELQMGLDEPWRPLWLAVESAAYRVHPYHHPVIGWREELELLERDTMMDYYRRHYAPDRASLIVVGDVSTASAMDEIRETLGKLPASGVERARVLQEEEQEGERRVELAYPGQLARCAFAWHTCRTGERDDTVLDLASTLLSSGKTSRLYRGLIQGREIATLADVYNETRLDPGLFWIIAEGKPETRPADLEAALLEELDRFIKEGPGEEELARAKKQILNSFFFSLETVGSQAQRLGSAEVLAADGYKVLERYPEELRSIQGDEICKVLARYLRRENRTVGWSLPKEQATSEEPGVGEVAQ